MESGKNPYFALPLDVAHHHLSLLGGDSLFLNITRQLKLTYFIHDNSHPVLYRDGDLVFISPAACKAAIEVKSKLYLSNLAEAVRKLSYMADKIRHSRGAPHPFIGLFSYESDVNVDMVLNALVSNAEQNQFRVVDHIAIGDSLFVKYWHNSPVEDSTTTRTWRAYNLPKMSVGYFIHNLLMHLSPDANRFQDSVWFPESSKEEYFLNSRPLIDASN